ncbi:unnamed protein product, partial [Effrenium voratum]
SAQWAGPIGLATGCELHGYCKVVSSRPVSREELLALQHRTCCPPELINYKQPWVWELTEVHRLSDPLSLPRKKGQVVWVRVHGPSLLPPPAGDANQKVPPNGSAEAATLQLEEPPQAAELAPVDVRMEATTLQLEDPPQAELAPVHVRMEVPPNGSAEAATLQLEEPPQAAELAPVDVRMEASNGLVPPLQEQVNQ